MKRLLALWLILLLLAAGCTSTTTPVPGDGTPFVSGIGQTYEVRGAVRAALIDSEAAPTGARVRYRVLRDGQEVLSGESVAEEDGSFVLGIHMREADVLELEGSALGYQASGVRYSAAEIEQGALPEIELEPLLSDALQVVDADWRPDSPMPGIQEPSGESKGGLLTLQLLNAGARPITLEEVVLDGVDPGNSDLVQWLRLRPDAIPAAGTAICQFRLSAAPEEVTISLYPVGHQPVAATIALTPSLLRISHVTWSEDGEQLLVFARNQTDAALIDLEGLLLNGVEVRARILQGELASGETGLIVADPGFGPSASLYLHCRVVATIRGGGEISAWAQVRSLQPAFPLAIWADLNELEPEVVADLRDHGLDTLVLELPATPADPRWQQLRREQDLSLIAVPRFPASAAQIGAFAPDERILAWLIQDYQGGRQSLELFNLAGRGSLAPRSWRYSPAYVELEAEYHRLSTLPTLASLPSLGAASEYGPVADLLSPEHFAVDSPGTDYWGMHGVMEVFSYTLGMRDQVAPQPVWPWVQALCSTSWYRDTSACWNRLPTPSEMRAQLYAQLAAGAKGVLWYSHRIPYVAEGPEQWAELGELNRLLLPLRDLLLYGDVADTARVRGGEALARAIVSEHSVLVPIVSLAQSHEERTWLAGQDPPPPSPPTTFLSQEGLDLELLLPQWIDPSLVVALSPDGLTRLNWTEQARLATVSLPTLDDVAMILFAEDSGLVQEIQRALE